MFCEIDHRKIPWRVETEERRNDSVRVLWPALVEGGGLVTLVWRLREEVSSTRAFEG